MVIPVIEFQVRGYNQEENKTKISKFKWGKNGFKLSRVRIGIKCHLTFEEKHYRAILSRLGIYVRKLWKGTKALKT